MLAELQRRQDDLDKREKALASKEANLETAEQKKLNELMEFKKKQADLKKQQNMTEDQLA